MKFSLHTHSQFCDGKTDMDQVCQAAIDKKINVLGFSSHAPVPIKTFWAMPFERLSDYLDEVNRCQLKYSDQLQIYRSLEADYIPGKTIAFDQWRKLAQLDYVIGSVHLILNPENGKIMGLDGTPQNYDDGLLSAFGGDIKKAVSCYYKQIQDMVRLEKPEIIGHMDKVVMNNQNRYFSPQDAWHQQLIDETLLVIQAHSGIVEVNTRGVYRGKYHTWFPNEAIVKRCVALNIPLTISVDAHQADDLLACFQEAAETLKEAGADSVGCLIDNKWEQIPISAVLAKE